jgi:hypothetical protein
LVSALLALGAGTGVVAEQRMAGSVATIQASREPLVAFSPTSGQRIARFPQVDHRPLKSERTAGVFAIADDGHGGWWIGGSFRAIGDAHCANLAHIRADLSVDRNCPNIAAPYPGAAVVALARRRNVLFLGGFFYRVGGQRRSGLAAVSSTSGELLPWNPRSNEGASSLALAGRTLYAAGSFSHLGGKRRFSLGAIDVGTAKATAWDPRPDANIHGDSADTVVQAGSVVYVAGAFAHLRGVSRPGFAATSAKTGAPLPSPPLSKGFVNSFTVIGRTLYVSVGDPAKLEAFDSATGAVKRAWKPGYSGEPQATSLLRFVGVTRNSVYVASGIARADVIRVLDANTGQLRSWRPRGLVGNANVLAVSRRYVLIGTSPRYP